MEKIKTFFKTSIIGGIIVILPVALTLMIFRWMCLWTMPSAP
jgi:uncharacterized membrane protein